jgi:fructose-1,6-bisphosphatase I
MTLTRFILSEQQKFANASGDLTIILAAISTACKAIASACRRGALVGLYGVDGSTNSTGDSVKKLDVLSDEIFVNSLRHTRRVALLVSEERELPVVVEGAESAKYICSFDPLDGSSNIDCNVAVGSIFGISRRASGAVGSPATAAEALQPGSSLVCAGYCVYGPSTQLVMAFAGDTVNVFTLDVTIGEFILSQSALRIPAAPQRIYSLNEANIKSAPAGVARFVAECKDAKFSARYTGSMVSDVHRTLLYGGVFIYPATRAAPSGKLRVLYEVHPMAMLVEAAGGKAITGAVGGGRGQGVRALDLVASGPHDRSGIILGCARDVDRIAQLLDEED